MDFRLQLGQFLLDFEDFQPGQLPQPVGDNGARLGVVKPELFHDGGFRLSGPALAGADGGDDLVDDINRPFEPLEDMGAVGSPF